MSDGSFWPAEFVFKVIDKDTYTVTGADGKTPVVIEWGNGTYDTLGINHEWGDANLMNTLEDISNVAEIEGVTLQDHVFS